METKKEELEALVQELEKLTAELDEIKKKIGDLLGKTEEIYQDKVCELKAEFDRIFALVLKKNEELDHYIEWLESRKQQEIAAREALMERANALLQQIEQKEEHE